MTDYSYQELNRVSTHATDSWRSLNVANGVIKDIDPATYEKKFRASNLLLIAAPGSDEFVNPLRITGFGNRLFKKWNKEQLTICVMFSMIGIALSGYVFAYPDSRYEIQRTAVIIALFVTTALSIYLSSNKPNQIAERIDLIRFVRLHFFRLNIPTFAMGVVSTLILIEGWSDMHMVYEKYGASSYKVTDPMQWWRFITGPFVHSGPHHLFANFVTLLVLFPLASLDKRLYPTCTFLLGCIFSHVCFIALRLLNFHDSDLLLGASGGDFALLGALITSCLLEKEIYPENFSVTMIGFTFLSFFGAMIMSFRASQIAHFSGLVSGVIIYLLIRLSLWIASGRKQIRSENILSATGRKHPVSGKST